MGTSEVLSTAGWVDTVAEPFLPEDMAALSIGFEDTDEHDQVVLLALTTRTLTALRLTIRETRPNGFNRKEVDVDQASVPLSAVTHWEASWTGPLSRREVEAFEMEGLRTPGALIDVGRDLLGFGNPIRLPLTDLSQDPSRISKDIHRFISVLEKLR